MKVIGILDPKNVIIIVVTVTGWGPHPTYSPHSQFIPSIIHLHSRPPRPSMANGNVLAITSAMATWSSYPWSCAERKAINDKFGDSLWFHACTVDGRNPAPVDMVNFTLFTSFYTSLVVSRISSINSITKHFGYLKWRYCALEGYFWGMGFPLHTPYIQWNFKKAKVFFWVWYIWRNHLKQI